MQTPPIRSSFGLGAIGAPQTREQSKGQLEHYYGLLGQHRGAVLQALRPGLPEGLLLERIHRQQRQSTRNHVCDIVACRKQRGGRVPDKLTRVVEPTESAPKIRAAAAAEDDVCAVCLDDFGIQSVLQLSCKHRFHTECFKNWLEKMSTTQEAFCPLCKAAVLSLLNEEE